MLSSGRPWGTVALFVIIAGAWAVDTASCGGWLIPAAAHGLADIGTASATMITAAWLLIRHYVRPHLEPGQVIISAEDYRITKDIYRDLHGVPASKGGEQALRSA